MPIAVTLWYMSMDVAVMIMGDQYDFQFRALVSMYFGLLMILVAFWVDLRSGGKADYAFWGGITAQESDSELAKLIYFCVNIFMVAVGVIIVRRVFVVFGAIGACLYLGYLASDFFEDSWLFPITLTAIGLLIIYLGVFWQKHEKVLTEKSRSLLPPKFKEYLDARVI